MAYFERQGGMCHAFGEYGGVGDWCHLCGTRQTQNVSIWYPNNAEHEENDLPGKGGKYTRICAECGELIARIGRGELHEATRNNPAIRAYKSRHRAPSTT
jgi:hypothetical protein